MTGLKSAIDSSLNGSLTVLGKDISSWITVWSSYRDIISWVKAGDSEMLSSIAEYYYLCMLI